MLEQRILTEAAVAVWLALPLGLGAFALIRRFDRSPAPALAEAPSAAEEFSLDEGPPADLPPVRRSFRHTLPDLFLALVLCWLVMASSFANTGSAPSSGTPADEPGPEISAGAVLLNVILTHGMQIAVIWAYLSRVRLADPIAVFGLRKYPVSRGLGIAFVYLLPAAFLSIGMMAWIYHALKGLGFHPAEQEAVTILRTQSDFALRAVIAFTACLSAPIVEELLFRGLLYGALKQFTDRWFAAVFSALLFGVTHAHLPGALPLAVLGFFLALAYETTGSLAVPIFMHALFNSSQVFMAS